MLVGGSVCTGMWEMGWAAGGDTLVRAHSDTPSCCGEEGALQSQIIVKGTN